VSALHNSPDLCRLHFLEQPSLDAVAQYLRVLQARHYAPKTMQTTIGMIKTFCVCLPASCRSRIYRDFTRTTAADIDAWLDAAHHHGFAPATINNILNTLHRFFAFLQEQGQLPRQPIHRRRHQVLVPHTLPRPMVEGDVVQFFQVIDAVRDRAMFLLMLSCGLRVGEVSTLTWSAMDVQMCSLRIDTSKGQVDRVVYYSSDAAKALHQWRHLQSPAGACWLDICTRLAS
jgi:site-specific recombinase XerD